MSTDPFRRSPTLLRIGAIAFLFDPEWLIFGQPWSFNATESRFCAVIDIRRSR
jgi:hypothetical protein